MRKNAIKLSFVILFLLSWVVIFFINKSSTKGDASEAKQIPLRIITEQTVSDGMNYQLQSLAEQFQEDNPNITISIEVLPAIENERTNYIDKIKSEIDAGFGPDIFLLPTSNVIVSDYPKQYTYYQINPFFPNVELSMRSNQFADISYYYNTDNSLKKDALSKEIMDAGLIGHKRYVLPIRFDIPIVYSFGNSLDDLDIEAEISDLTIDEWMDLAIEQNNHVLACGIEYISVNAFSNLINYNRNKVLLSVDQIETYFTKFQSLETLINSERDHRETAQLSNVNTLAMQFPVKIDPLASSFAYAALALSKSETLSMYPLRSTDGDIIATVSYYGAVSSNCENVDIAYSFLRLFLMEEAQWEENRPKPATSQYEGLVEGSWPVRTHGSVESLWNNLKEQIQGYAKLTNIDVSEMEEAIIGVLDCNVDIVRFPFPNNFSNLLNQLNNFQKNNAATSVNIKELSQEFIKSLDESLLN